MTRDHLRALWVVLGFWLVLVAKALLVRYIAFSEIDLLRTVVFEGSVILGVLLLVDAFFADHRLTALVVADAVLSLIMAATALYASFYGAIPTAESLVVARQAATVGDSIFSLLDPIYLLFFIDVVVLIAGLAMHAWRRRRSTEQKGAESDYTFQHRLVYAALVPAIALLAASVISVGMLPRPVDSLEASRARGILAFEIASLLPHAQGPEVDIDVRDHRAVQGRIDAARAAGESSRTADFAPGDARGKNLIVIQVEALQSAVVGRVIDGQEVTPNLNRLIEGSWYFPNAISQSGRGTTSDAEFISNTSLYPAPSAPSSVVYVDRVLPSLPRLLAKDGYATATFHTNKVSYWNRKQLYGALGFDRYFDQEYFGTADKIAFGPSDEVLFAKSLEQLEAMRATQKPFYAQIITMSSHYPYQDIPADRIQLAVGEPYAGTLTGHYLQSINYTDRAIGGFIDELERSGLADESIIVVYGDHSGLGEEPEDAGDAAARQVLFGGEYSPFERTRIPLIVRMPGQAEGKVVSRPFGQVDLMPTLADPLGVDLSATPHFGSNAFAGGSVLLPSSGFMPPGTYVDEQVMFVPRATFDDGQAYSIPQGSELGITSAERRKWQWMRDLTVLSEAYVRALPARVGFDPDSKYVLPEGKM